MASRPERALPPLHVVTDDAVIARPDFLGAARRVMEAGGGEVALHLRAPSAGGRRVFDLAERLREMAIAADARLFVNDRVDVALAVDADGVQLGARGMEIGDARRILGPGRWIGASVHSGREAWAASDRDADFLLVGTIHESASHPGRLGVGVRLIDEVASAGLPVIAVGGMTPERVGDVLAAGAAGVAAIRGVWDAGDVGEAVKRYLGALGR